MLRPAATETTTQRRRPDGRRRHGLEPVGRASLTGKPDAPAPTTAPTPVGHDDRMSALRSEIIVDFRLRGAERCAAASPVAGCPQTLRSSLEALRDEHRVGVWVALERGLGGVASWIERSVGAPVVVVDASTDRLRASRRLFPSLHTCVGEHHQLPVRSGGAAVTVAAGVVSRSRSIDDLLAEAGRVLASGGHLLVLDAFSSTEETHRTGAVTCWALEALDAAASVHGFQVVHAAVSDPSAGWWPDAAEQVADEIARRSAGRPGYEAWCSARDDEDHAIRSSRTLAAGVLLRLVDRA